MTVDIDLSVLEGSGVDGGEVAWGLNVRIGEKAADGNGADASRNADENE